MNEPIVSSLEPLGLIGGAPAARAAFARADSHVAGWVAADGGADLLLEQGRRPRAVIGDMDSISDAARTAFAGALHPIAEQDSTDFDKALRNITAPLIVAAGVLGGRLDHTLSVLNTLLRRADQRIVLVGDDLAVTHLAGPLELDLPAGALLSLFPLRPVRVESSGLVWPTGGIDFAPDGRVGTSNAARGGALRLTPSGPGMLVMVPVAYLSQLLPG